MTERDDSRSLVPPAGRLDLRALDAATDDLRTETIIRAVIRQLPPRQSGADLAPPLARLQRGLAAAAVVLAMLATAAVLTVKQQGEAHGDTRFLERWMQSGHVPTNGELLTAYQGYRP